jgi:hypothetical protein
VPDIFVARYPDGVRPPMRLELSGGVPYGVEPGRGFSVDWLDRRGEIVFHFNPRPEQDAIALNSYLGSAWGEQELVPGYRFQHTLEAPLRLRFDVLADRFRIFVEGRRLGDFLHRRPPGEIAEVRCSGWFWRLEPARPRSRLRRGRRSPKTALAPEIVPSSRRSAAVGSRVVDWVAAEENPAEAECLPSFRLFAVLDTWMEEDVVAATVANCFLQGCEAVYLVDNDSPDRTVETAVQAGAVVARVYPTERFDKVEKMKQMHDVVEEVSRAANADHVWWLWVDADEFYRGPGGSTLRTYLGSLDRRFRIVGGRFFQHFPSREPAYVVGHHPLEFQPLCYETPLPNCELGHARHSLQRWDRTGPPITCHDGFHTAESSEALLEPALPVLFHHFPYRAEAVTRRRLATLTESENGTSRIANVANAAFHMQLRLHSLDAVYRRRWDEVAFYPPLTRGWVPELKNWDDWVDPTERQIPRWY